jgi:hypothetical protein
MLYGINWFAVLLISEWCTKWYTVIASSAVVGMLYKLFYLLSIAGNGVQNDMFASTLVVKLKDMIIWLAIND